MITAGQMRAGRALLGIDQRRLAVLAGVSLPTIQRMEASDGTVRGVIDTLMKVVAAFEAAGIELIGEEASSTARGRGVRLRESADQPQPLASGSQVTNCEISVLRHGAASRLRTSGRPIGLEQGRERGGR